jgi:hypothetical protein
MYRIDVNYICLQFSKQPDALHLEYMAQYACASRVPMFP